MSRHRILVFGGRDFANLFGDEKPISLRCAEHRFVMQCIGDYVGKQYNDVLIISGCARGVDTVGIDFALKYNLPYLEFPISKADWKKYGNYAGPRRNQQMIDEGKPDVGLRFPGGNGTRDMAERLDKHGIMVIDYTKEWKC